jgi:ABC-type multidrug transport system fused ATPase/permease subunit
MKKTIEETTSSTKHHREGASHIQTTAASIPLCTCAFIACMLVSLAPLDRFAGTNYFRALPISSWLLAIGTWLPLDLHLTINTRQSQMSTHLILFLSLIALAFIVYGICAWCIQHSTQHSLFHHYSTIMKWIWLGTIISGLALVFTPAMLSHDAFVYAGYGRLLTVYHENPYFVTLSTHPGDLFTRLDDWNNAPAAYGPLWLIVSALGSLIAGNHPLNYILLYRLLGLGTHLLNMLLISRILRATGRTERTIVLGVLLYAWNPLILLESSLGAHMDTSMVTLMLGGILYWIQREQKHTTTMPSLRTYLPSLLCFTLATLIKFTAILLIALFLALLARKMLYSTQTENLSGKIVLQWRAAIRTVMTGGIISASVALASYIPFWIGYNPRAIIASFTTPPSANSAYGSILSAILNWIRWNGQHNPGRQETLLFLFSQQKIWQIITVITLMSVMIWGIIWLWKAPTARTLALATLAVLGALLLVTPWFFPWYVVWIVGLAAICLPVNDRSGRALVGATLAFSASAFFIYLFRGFSPIGDWEGFTCLATVAPPVLTLIVLLILPQKQRDINPHSAI